MLENYITTQIPNREHLSHAYAAVGIWLQHTQLLIGILQQLHSSKPAGGTDDASSWGRVPASGLTGISASGRSVSSSLAAECNFTNNFSLAIILNGDLLGPGLERCLPPLWMVGSGLLPTGNELAILFPAVILS